MLNLRTVGGVAGTALAIALSCAAADQSPAERLAEGQRLSREGHFDEARKVFVAVIRDAQKGPADERFAAIAMDDLGLNELDAGIYTAAETAFNHALASLRSPAPDDPELIELKTHLAELYIAELRPEDAEPLVRQVAAALRSSSQPDPLAVARAYDDIAVACIMLHKLRDCETLLRQSMSLVENLVGPDDPRLASSLLTYAGLLSAEHRYEEALIPAQKAWQILRDSTAPVAKSYLASAAIVLSAVYYHTDRVQDSLSLARQSVELAEEGMGPAHPRLGVYLSNYANILRRANHKKEAKEIQQRADAILAEHPANVSNGTGYTVNVAALR